MTDPLRLGGVPEHFNLPWRLALESGELDGIDAAWTDQPGGTGQMLAGLEDGELDIVSILTEGTVAAIDAGLPVTIVQVYVESPLQWGVFVPPSSGIEHLDQLEGQPVAITRYRSGSHLMAFIQADRHGWALEPEQFVVVGGLKGAREHFVDGTPVQFMCDRFTTQPLVDSGEFRRVGVEPTPWPSFVIAVRDEILLGRTAETGAVIDAVVREATGLQSRPGVVDTIVERYGVTPTGAEEWLSATSFGVRAPFDPKIAADTLGTLRRTGFDA